MNLEQFKLSKQEVKKLGTPSYMSSYFIVALNTGMFLGIIIMLWLAQLSAGLVLLAIVLWALQMNHSYLLVHETCHGSFLENARRNKFYGQISAFFALMPFYVRREEHSMHHRVAGSFEEGTNWRAMERFLTIRPLALKLISICWKLWIPIFAINEQFMLWKMAFDKDAPRDHKKSAAIHCFAYVVIIVLGVLLTSLSSVAVFATMVFLPTVYLYMMLVEFFNAPHHLDSPVEDIRGDIPFYEQMKFTRSCSPLPRPLNYFYALNFNYHEAHHLYPSLHWTQLQKAHKIMQKFDPSLGYLEPEYKINTSLHKKPIRQALWKYFDFLPIFNERLKERIA